MGSGRHMANFAGTVTALLASLFISCGEEPTRGGVDTSGKGLVTVTFGTDVPRHGLTRSLAAHEEEITEVGILVFYDDVFQKYTSASELTGSDGKYTFKAPLDYSDDPVTLYVVPNAGGTLGLLKDAVLVKGTSKAEVIAGLNESFSGYADGTVLNFPMFGIVTVPELTGDVTVSGISLVRAFARVEVELTEEALKQFRITEVRGYRAASSFALLSDKVNTAGTKISGATLPEGVTYSISTLPVAAQGHDFVTGLYLPEGNGVASGPEADGVTCIVLGGKFAPDGNFEGVPDSYYRIDLKNDGIHGNIIRNHSYIVTITSVSGQGETTPGEAALTESTFINTSIIDWADDGSNTIYDINGQWLNVSSRTIPLFFYTNSTNSITVRNTIPNIYSVQFANEDGTPAAGSGVAHYGESIDNGLFRVLVSDRGGDGTISESTITVTALENNELEGEQVTQKLYVIIGNIRFNLTIVQDSRDMRDHVHLFNLLEIKGTVGDQYLGTSVNIPADRKLYDLLMNDGIFGIDGLVPFKGFKISGLNWNIPLTKNLLEHFDVFFIGDEDKVVSAQEAVIVEFWRAQGRHVLVSYICNTNLMTYYGVTTNPPVWPGNLGGYKVDDDAPDFITDGPVGNVAAGTVMNQQFHGYSIHTIDRSVALARGITPVIVAANDSDVVVIGIDTGRRIVYYNDHQLYTPSLSLITGDGKVETPLDTVIANIWAWVAETSLGDRGASNG